jgi:hypothetical protein
VDGKICCSLLEAKVTAIRELRSVLSDFFGLVSQKCPTEAKKPAFVAGVTW